MRKFSYLPVVLIMTMMVWASCQQTTVQETYEAEWLGQTKQEMINNLEEQFQGFSRTMVETAYRYHELYWAGKDQNWEYAEYQREHIEEVLVQGFVRRPERELSSRQFMTIVLPDMEQAIASNDLSTFLKSFTQLTNTCNTCHQMEDVAFMTVAIPKNRHTVIYY